MGELELLKEFWYYIPGVVWSKHVAEVQTQNHYLPEESKDGNIRNAFKHASWTMLLYDYTSAKFALDFVTAHENFDGNSVLHKEMDMFNNRVAYNYFTSNNFSSVGLSDDEINAIVESMVNNGELIYIVFDYEYISMSIYYMATGITIRKTAIGDFYAYTNSTEPYNVPETVYEVVPKIPGDIVLRP